MNGTDEGAFSRKFIYKMDHFVNTVKQTRDEWRDKISLEIEFVIIQQ